MVGGLLRTLLVPIQRMFIGGLLVGSYFWPGWPVLLVLVKIPLLVPVWASLGLLYYDRELFISWYAGRWMDGIRRTNATFLLESTKSADPSEYAHPWSRLPGKMRAFWRNAPIWLLALLTQLWMWQPWLAVCTGVGLCVWGGWYVYKHVPAWIRSWRHYRKVTLPLYKALKPKLKLSPVKRPREVVQVSRDYKHAGGKIILHVGTGYNLNERPEEAAKKLIQRRVGGVWDVVPELEGDDPVFKCTRRATSPEKVTYKDAHQHMLNCPDHKIFLGLGERAEPVYWDLLDDSPHLLFSVPTGHGKSSALRLAAVQFRRRGQQVYILDGIKHGASHDKWARDMDGVYTARNIAAVHYMLMDIREEMDRRFRILEELDPNATFPRVLVIPEEMNATMPALQAWWVDNRKTLGSDAQVSPARRALEALVHAGRQVGIHEAAAFQKATSLAAGGTAAREGYGRRLLSGKSSGSVWDMLTDIPKMDRPRPVKRRGFAYAVTADEVEEVQMAFLTEEPDGGEARAFALSGESATESNDDPVSSPPGSGLRLETTPQLLTLSEIVARQLVPLSRDALKKRRQRDNDFPDPVERNGGMEGDRFSEQDITEWWERINRS